MLQLGTTGQGPTGKAQRRFLDKAGLEGQKPGLLVGGCGHSLLGVTASGVNVVVEGCGVRWQGVVQGECRGEGESEGPMSRLRLQEKGGSDRCGAGRQAP